MSSDHDWQWCHELLSELFEPEHAYAGYKPNEAEAPNGDGVVDAGKRYLHVALKYDPPGWALDILAIAHFQALRIAERIGIPDAYYPRIENGTLRVLEYGPGDGSAEHTDFDLFTVNLWRSDPTACEAFAQYGPEDAHWVANPFGYHTGEIGALVGLGHATPHRVIARPYAQKALVYFAMPANGARLWIGTDKSPTVAEWVAERTARSRVKL